MTLSRVEADLLMQAYDDAVCDYRIWLRLHGADAVGAGVTFVKMNAARERVLDAICQEEATQELHVRVTDGGYTVTELVIAIAGIATLVGVAAGIYALVHFIAKAW